MKTPKPFWEEKKLSEMTVPEWESLCDSCGKCCLNKIEDEDTHEILYTNAVCNLIDFKTCRCTRYKERQTLVPDCLDLKDNFTQYHWLPSTCAYRILSEGRALPSWHPLISGTMDSVDEAGVSIRSYAVYENTVDDILDHIIEWL
ncbi:MAG: YcgN family cysteine cluster protein [Methylococcales bacterium]